MDLPSRIFTQMALVPGVQGGPEKQRAAAVVFLKSLLEKLPFTVTLRARERGPKARVYVPRDPQLCHQLNHHCHRPSNVLSFFFFLFTVKNFIREKNGE